MNTNEENKKGVYIIEFENGIKFGKTSNINNRARTYKSQWVRSIKRSRFFETQNCDQLEREIKNHYLENIRSTKPSREFISDIGFDEVEALIITLLVMDQEGVIFKPKRRRKKNTINFKPCGMPDWCK